MSKIRLLIGTATALLTCVGLTLGGAEAATGAYPNRPVHFIVGFAPGGSTDAVARIVGQKLSEKWGQPVVVENRPGADGTMAMGAVSQAEPDGYTIGWTSTAHAIAPLHMKVGYDPVTDFSPVTIATASGDVLMVQPSFPANTFKEFIAYVKQHPNEFNFGTNGPGSAPYLVMSALDKLTGMKMVFVTYKGGSEVVTGLMRGDIHAYFGSVTSAKAQLQAGNVKPLAVTTLTRSPALPDVPTVAEAADLPGFDSSTWAAVLAPPKTPPEIVHKLQADIAEVVQTPEVKERLASLGVVPVANTPEEFAEKIKATIAQWTPYLKND